MKISSYLEQALSYEQSPATDQYFEVRASQLFEQQGGSSCIRIYVQRPSQDQGVEKWNLVQKCDPQQDFECNSEPPSPVDWHRYPRECPPHYVGGPGLEQQKVSNAEDLEKIASVRNFIVVMIVQADLIFK